MATFNFNCPQCGNLLSGEDEWRGMETQCPECKKNIVIPPTEQPLLVTPNHPSNILPQASTSTTTHKAIKKISRFDNKILRIIKILLFCTVKSEIKAHIPRLLVLERRLVEASTILLSVTTTATNPLA